jgi:arylsulfatase A-like enzyme
VDAVLGELLDSLRAEGWLAGSWVVVTADHGELLGEGQRYLHGESLSLPEIRVPLLVRGPGALGRAVDLPVSLIDVAPTLLDLAGVAPPLDFLGRSLRPALEGGSLAARPVVAELHARHGAEPLQRLVAVDGTRRVTVGADGALTLSEGAGGAGEAPPRPATAAELSALLGELAPFVVLEREPAQALPPLPDETRERLRALGYQD